VEQDTEAAIEDTAVEMYKAQHYVTVEMTDGARATARDIERAGEAARDGVRDAARTAADAVSSLGDAVREAARLVRGRGRSEEAEEDQDEG